LAAAVEVGLWVQHGSSEVPKWVQHDALASWTKAARTKAWAQVTAKERKKLNNRFGEWLKAYWALKHRGVDEGEEGLNIGDLRKVGAKQLEGKDSFDEVKQFVFRENTRRISLGGHGE
jgi:coproporphyrinogen III oxidase